jgi:hypothetical protein
MHLTYGGPFEYFAAALLVLQVLVGRSYFRSWRATLLVTHGATIRSPRPLFIVVVFLLALLWLTTFAAVWLTFSGLMYTSRAVPAGLGATVSAIGYTWILLSSFAAVVGAAARFLATRSSVRHSSTRRSWLRNASLVAVGAPVAAIGFGIIQRNQCRVNELDLPVTGLHPDLEGLRIAQVSDLHVSPFLSIRQAARVIDMANELHCSPAT